MDIKEKLLTKVKNLPTLPTVYSALSEAMQDPRASSDKIASIISNDQVSAFKILKVANSPFFGFRGRIDTITQAIMYLGFNEVRNIVFAISVIDFFSKDKTLLNFRPVDFWAHSIGVGIITRMIGRGVGEKNLENFFLSGILHDIGKLLFFNIIQNEYSEVLDLVESNRISIKEAEKKVLGIDHSDAGYLLADKWKLPVSLQKVISNHHIGRSNDTADLLVASVHLADIAARILELGYAGDNLVPEPNISVWEVVKLPPGFFAASRSKIMEDYEHAVHLMLV
jgi:HD-like signal output (HDOD) protein